MIHLLDSIWSFSNKIYCSFVCFCFTFSQFKLSFRLDGMSYERTEGASSACLLASSRNPKVKYMPVNMKWFYLFHMIFLIPFHLSRSNNFKNATLVIWNSSFWILKWFFTHDGKKVDMWLTNMILKSTDEPNLRSWLSLPLIINCLKNLFITPWYTSSNMTVKRRSI